MEMPFLNELPQTDVKLASGNLEIELGDLKSSRNKPTDRGDEGRKAKLTQLHIPCRLSNCNQAGHERSHMAEVSLLRV